LIRALVARMLVLGTALGATACILLVGDDEYGDRCTFKGEDTECGKCIAKSCQSTINACCDDYLCRGTTMTALDQCASQTASIASCSLLKLDESSRSDFAEVRALKECITAACAVACKMSF
jgi:hypothetical protein